MRPDSRLLGIALWELLVALTVVGCLVAATVPSFTETRRRAALTSSVNQMVGALHFARSSAILRDIPAVLCLSPDGRRCAGRPEEAASGWLVFHAATAARPPRLQPGEEPLRRYELPRDIEISATRTVITFWPTSRSGTTGTFRFCSAGGKRTGRSVIVSQTGRPRVAALGDTECAP